MKEDDLKTLLRIAFVEGYDAGISRATKSRDVEYEKERDNAIDSALRVARSLQWINEEK